MQSLPSAKQEKASTGPETCAQQSDAAFAREGLMRSPVYLAREEISDSQANPASAVVAATAAMNETEPV